MKPLNKHGLNSYSSEPIEILKLRLTKRFLLVKRDKREHNGCSNFVRDLETICDRLELTILCKKL